MKLFLVCLGLLAYVLSILAFAGCGYVDRAGSTISGQPSKICAGGVVYLQFTSGATPAYHQDGSLIKCDK
jgi:hypothetical protein